MLFSLQVLQSTAVKIDDIDMWELQDLENVLPKITSYQHLHALLYAGVRTYRSEERCH